MEREGLRLFAPAAALIRVPEAFFQRYPVEAQVALSGIRDASDVLGRLLDGGHSAVAGRLAGAFRRLDRDEVADEIVSAMKAAGYDVRESDPFEAQQAFGAVNTAAAPIVGRLQAHVGIAARACARGVSGGAGAAGGPGGVFALHR